MLAPVYDLMSELTGKVARCADSLEPGTWSGDFANSLSPQRRTSSVLCWMKNDSHLYFPKVAEVGVGKRGGGNKVTND